MRSWVGTAVALVALSSGCGAHEVAPAAVGAPAPVATAVLPCSRETTVRLLEEGRPPLRLLRFHPAMGAAPPVSIFIDDGYTAATLAPHVVAVGANGDLRYEFAAVETGWVRSSSDGLTGSAEVTSRGVVRNDRLDGFHYEGAHRDAIQSLSTGFLQAMRDFSPVLPEEPVGVGARWEVISPISRDYLGATLIRVHELTVLDGERCSVHVLATVRGERHWVEYPNQGDRDRDELLSMSGAGAAQLEFLLDHIPVAMGLTELSYDAHVRRDTGSAARGWTSEQKHESGAFRTDVRPGSLADGLTPHSSL